MDRWGDSQRDRDALDRHITGNYGEDQFKDGEDEEIRGGMVGWEPGTLPSRVLDRVTQDALADLWRECDPQFADHHWNRTQQLQRFRERLMELIRSTTGESMRII